MNLMECRGGLFIDPELVSFVETELVAGTDLTPDAVWSGLSDLVRDHGRRNKLLLEERDRLQELIDDWHRNRAETEFDVVEYRRFLVAIGYIVQQGSPFTIDTDGVDSEISEIAGPQLVVPVTNARYALNAANARWGSLYDALYGTDALGGSPPGGEYDPKRGAGVVTWVREFFDDVIPLAKGSHADVLSYGVAGCDMIAQLADGSKTGLVDGRGFFGFTGEAVSPASVVFVHHGLGIEVVIDRAHPVGASNPAGVADVRLESAVTSIIDLEDSVATVDATDKVQAYRNWLGLIDGSLTEEVAKSGQTSIRRLAEDRVIVGPDRQSRSLRSRALLLSRNVGHLMSTPAVTDATGEQIPEGFLDAMITVAVARRDIIGPSRGRNSRTGSIYIVKPKMHGPDEVAFACEVFDTVERCLGLPPETVKLGIMDEERRTTVNLTECIRAARSRLAFINTGFLDRTGDEIHTSMEAGAMVRKTDMKSQPWIRAYEDWNVDVGLACGLQGRAQIGKGMWAAPDRMSGLLAEKIAHPLAGATCAWVPSPTAATLHATHYHRVDVASRQSELSGRTRASLDELLTIPVAPHPRWTADEVQSELDNNAQSILGYVVRWVDQGIGCSKVPDIFNVALMEDRATCRISSQHIANWLRHRIVSTDQVDTTLRKMAQVVDDQNSGDPLYQPIGPHFDGLAFNAAHQLVFEGAEQPSGYTEPILHQYRQWVKHGYHREARP